MIIVRLCGGLGNQLFQYAFGYSLSKAMKQELVFDCSFYTNQPGYTGKRKVEIASLAISDLNAYEPSFLMKTLSNRYVGAVLRKLPTFSIPIGNGIRYVKEPIHKYVPNLQCEGSTYYDGYWQTSKYFSNVREDLLEMFYPKEGFSSAVLEFFDTLKQENSVAVHIRKGDFKKKGFRTIGHPLPISYYEKAIEFCKEKLGNPVFYIVSDNPDWVKECLHVDADIRYVSDYVTGDALTDIFCISNCRNGIASASTFSWWGNWLRKTEGLVVVPNRSYYNEFFWETDWVKLDYDEEPNA